MIFVTGATGQVGSALVRQLQAARLPFAALAHSDRSFEHLQAQGVTTVRGDYNSPEGWEAALQGQEQLFLLTPSSPNQTAIEQGIITAAKRNGIQHIVKLSVFAADSEPVLSFHADSEAFLKAAGIAYTILRPNFFMQNFARIDAPTIIGQGAFYSTVGDGPISMIDAEDIAAVALATLTSRDYNGQTLTLTGPQALTYRQVADKLAAQLGKPVQYVDLPGPALKQGMQSGGVPEWYADLLVELFTTYREGRAQQITNTVAQVIGRQPRTLDDFLTANLAAFKA